MNPVADMRWRSGGAVYVWTPGRGWVAEPAVDNRGQISAAVAPAPPAELTRLRSIVAGFAAEQRARNACSLGAADPSARHRAAATIIALQLWRCRAARAKAELKCDSCGGRRSQWSKTALCRDCSIARQRAAGKPKGPGPTCSACGGPRSKFAAGTRCRKCWRANHEATKLAPTRIEEGPAHAALRAPPEPAPPSAQPKATPRWVDAPAQPQRASAPILRPQPPAEPESLPGPRVSRPGERVEQHPVLARHVGKAPVDPLAKPRERAPTPPPQFSPEFEAQLARVRAGAGIVAVAPIPRRGVVEGGTGSSLNFDG